MKYVVFEDFPVVELDTMSKNSFKEQILYALTAS